MSTQTITLLIILTPLFTSLVAGLYGHKIGRKATHRLTILGVALSFILSLYLAKVIFIDGAANLSWVAYQWIASGDIHFSIGFLIDELSILMMMTVTFVSLLVHIYSIGYMVDDEGYQRFFSYISAFTFAMLVLVTADNFLLLFFGWEGVGVVSYLLIGFWFGRDSAAAGSLKAFLVNRVGDFGFILALGAIVAVFGSLDYATVFAMVPEYQNATVQILPNIDWNVITVIALLLFVGAMGKSAQVPLHVWLPESMEGPTPISALIHAATMVTAGVYMVARLSPLYEFSVVALSTVLVIGATGALFLGLVAVVQNDIKRVVAYSTLSHLGYMMAGLGASAYAAGLFHLFTHASFKALLFLGAGSVIIAMHHEQDMRKMGGLRKFMPITYITFLIGGLSLAAIPPFSGFFSKDVIIEAVGASTIPGATYAYLCVLLGVFVTSLYIFRALFMTFHGEMRMSDKLRAHLQESPWVVWLPLVLLAIPSIFQGWLMVGPIVFNEPGLLGNVLYVAPGHDVLAKLGAHFNGALGMALHGVVTIPFWLAIAGIFAAWLAYIKKPELPAKLSRQFSFVYQVLIKKYGFDAFNEFVFVRGGRALGQFLYAFSDQRLIDFRIVNGTGRLMRLLSGWLTHVQTGYLYHYVFVMVIGLVGFLIWLLVS